MVASTITRCLAVWSLCVFVNAFTLEQPHSVLSQASRIHKDDFTGDLPAHYGGGISQDTLMGLNPGVLPRFLSPHGFSASKRDGLLKDLDYVDLIRRRKQEKSAVDKKKEADDKAKKEADNKSKKEADAKKKEADSKLKKEADAKKKEADTKRKEQEKADKKKKHDEKAQADKQKKEQKAAEKKKKEDDKANKRAKDNHDLELKANQKSADKHIKEVNKTGDWLAKNTQKEKSNTEKKEKKEKSKLKAAEKKLADAKKPGAGGKKHDKTLRKAEKEVEKAKGHLGKTEAQGKKSLEKLNSKADKSLNKSKQSMFDDWKKNNKEQWKITQDGIAEAIKHPSKAKQIGMKILKAFEWIGTAALSIIPGLGAAMAGAVTAAKTVATVAIKEGVKVGAKEAAKAAAKKGAKEAAKKIAKKGAKEGAKEATQDQPAEQQGTSTFMMNSPEDDKKAGIETNAMKLDVQNQRTGLTNQMDAAINQAKAKGAKMRRALEDMGVWDEALGLEMWRRCMSLDIEDGQEGVIMKRVVQVSVRREMERRKLEDVWY